MDVSALRLSHILCRVPDIHAAVADATETGFACAYGSDPATAHNALIWFEQGAFLEFFAFPAMDDAALLRLRLARLALASAEANASRA